MTITEEMEAEAFLEQVKKEKKFPVIEIFGPTIQGEGPLAGTKTMFVRFGGCDYRCQQCDSLHAVIPTAVKANARRMSAEEIATEIGDLVKSTGTPWVTLSGGNPCMHDLSMLISFLHGMELGIAVETQGTLNPTWLRRVQMLVISPKSPGMGEKFEPDKLSAMLLQAREHQVPTALKVVVFSQQDIDFAVDVINHAEATVPGAVHPGLLFLSLGNPLPPVLGVDNKLLTPVDGKSHVDVLLDSYRILVEDFVKDGRLTHVKFLPQLHVLLYSNETER